MSSILFILSSRLSSSLSSFLNCNRENSFSSDNDSIFLFNSSIPSLTYSISLPPIVESILSVCSFTNLAMAFIDFSISCSLFSSVIFKHRSFSLHKVLKRSVFYTSLTSLQYVLDVTEQVFLFFNFFNFFAAVMLKKRLHRIFLFLFPLASLSLRFVFSFSRRGRFVLFRGCRPGEFIFFRKGGLTRGKKKGGILLGGFLSITA